MYNHLDAVKSKYSLEQKMFFNSALKIVPKNVQFPLVFEKHSLKGTVPSFSKVYMKSTYSQALFKDL